MRIALLLLLISILFSCTKQKDITAVSITPLLTDSLSVRAIVPHDTSTVWFAANNGVVGLVGKGVKKLAVLKYEDTLLQFRAIAKTPKAIFVLSIGNPALLYKIGYLNSQATHVETVYKEIGPKVFYDAIAFWDDQEGIAMGDPVEDCLSILVTRDGGNTWNKISCNDLPKVVQGEAAFAASNTNISVFKNHVWIATGGKKARVFHSTDRGNTWEVFNTPILQGKPMTGIYSISFYNEKVGVIVGGDWENKAFNKGNKAITFDGGRTWKLLADGKDPGYLSCVAFVPNSKGKKIVAVSTNGVYSSNNQGNDWVQLSKEGFYAIKFVNDSIAFASGSNKIALLKFR